MVGLVVAVPRRQILLVADLPGRSGCRHSRAVWREAGAARTDLKCLRVACGRPSVLLALPARVAVPALQVTAVMAALVVPAVAAAAVALAFLRVAVVRAAMV